MDIKKKVNRAYNISIIISVIIIISCLLGLFLGTPKIPIEIYISTIVFVSTALISFVIDKNIYNKE